jgi:hypothetical protein
MRIKLAALLLLLFAFAAREFFFIPRALVPADAQIIVPTLLPPALGEFHAVTRWQREASPIKPLEVGASYRDIEGAEARLDFRLGARLPHNGVACWLVRGYPLLGEHQRRVRMGNRDPIFHTAFFRDSEGVTLVANTECYADGCAEDPIPESPRFQQQSLVNPEPVVPISIEVREHAIPASLGASPEVLEVRLLDDFTRFAAGIDLTPLFTRNKPGRSIESETTEFSIRR